MEEKAGNKWATLFKPGVETQTLNFRVGAAGTERLPGEIQSPAIKLRPPELPAQGGLRYLTDNELPVWDALVDVSPQGSLFCKSWWLKAISDEIRVLGYFESGRLIAGIPLYFERRMGLKVCCMPKLTQTWGVVVEPLPGKRASATARETRILETFAQRLAQVPLFVQAYHPECQNWLPFYWNGFTQTTHYTYVLDELESLDQVWSGLEQNQRTRIRKARKLGVTVKTCGPGVVYEASLKSFGRQGKRHPYSLDYLRRLYSAARKNDAGECFAAVDEEGNVHDAVFFVWDCKRGYYLAGGGDPSLRDSGGGSLLVWELLQYAAPRTRVFDFEGSMIRSIESYFRSFGSRRVAYSRVVKLPRWLRASLCLAGRIQL